MKKKQISKLIGVSVLSTYLIMPGLSVKADFNSWRPYNADNIIINLATTKDFTSLKQNIMQLSTKYGHLINVPKNLTSQIHVIFFNTMNNNEFENFWNNLSAKYESRGDFWSWLHDTFSGSYKTYVCVMSSSGLNCGQPYGYMCK